MYVCLTMLNWHFPQWSNQTAYYGVHVWVCVWVCVCGCVCVCVCVCVCARARAYKRTHTCAVCVLRSTYPTYWLKTMHLLIRQYRTCADCLLKYPFQTTNCQTVRQYNHLQTIIGMKFDLLIVFCTNSSVPGHRPVSIVHKAKLFGTSKLSGC